MTPFSYDKNQLKWKQKNAAFQPRSVSFRVFRLIYTWQTVADRPVRNIRGWVVAPK
jgi:hypothetical protein